MLKLIKVKNKNNSLSIKEHYLRRNKVLIKRRAGGFGDIVMQRMMMEDISKTGLEIYYTCPEKYLEIMDNHPYLKQTIDLSQIKDEDYGIIYDITTICAITESSLGPKNTRHRSDIWANHCGIKLNKHETYLKSDPEFLNFYKNEFKKINPENKKVVLISTKSVNNSFGEAKSLNEEQTKELVDKLRNENYFVITSNEEYQEIYSHLNVKQFIKLKTKEWISLIDACDLIISVDTAVFHIAGALKKPLIGIFSFVDGKIYGKYYDFILVQKHRDNGDWDCGPCYIFINCSKDKVNTKKPCINEITINEITNAIKSAQTRWKL